MGKLYYIATPYFHIQEEIRTNRYKIAVQVAGVLLQNNIHCFSPIAHNHHIALQYELPKGWDFWGPYDEQILKRCNGIIIVMADGWVESKGIAAEVVMAQDYSLPIYYMDYPDCNTWITKNKLYLI